jgi:hypothetical protein
MIPLRSLQHLPELVQPVKEARDKRIFDLWLACWTQEEIADAVGCDRHDVDNFLRKSADLPEYAKPAANHLTDFEPPPLLLAAIDAAKLNAPCESADLFSEFGITARAL